jgi:hypothetical protein
MGASSSIILASILGKWTNCIRNARIRDCFADIFLSPSYGRKFENICSCVAIIVEQSSYSIEHTCICVDDYVRTNQSSGRTKSGQPHS